MTDWWCKVRIVDSRRVWTEAFHVSATSIIAALHAAEFEATRRYPAGYLIISLALHGE